MNTGYDPLKKAGRTIAGIPKQIADAAGSIYANIFQNVKAPDPAVHAPPAPGSEFYPYYQIASGDTNLNDIAAKTNTPLDTIVQANNGAMTIPPKGSFIMLQPETARKDVFGTPPTPGRPGTENPGGTIQGWEGRGNFVSPTTAINTAFNQFQENYRLTGQADPKLLPTSINLATVKLLEAKGFFPSVDAAGNELTPAQALNAYGYEFKNGQFVHTGQVGGAASNKPDYSNPKAGMVMDNKFIAVYKQGRVVWQKINKPQAEAATPEAAANAAGTRTSVLGLRLGGG